MVEKVETEADPIDSGFSVEIKKPQMSVFDEEEASTKQAEKRKA